MKPTIEKDSPLIPLAALAVVFLVLGACGLGLAYCGGVFTGKNDVIANDKRIAQQQLLQSAPASPSGSGRP